MICNFNSGASEERVGAADTSVDDDEFILALVDYFMKLEKKVVVGGGWMNMDGEWLKNKKE